MEALIKSTGQIGEQILRLSKPQNRRNTLCISRFWGKDRRIAPAGASSEQPSEARLLASRKICRRDVPGDLFRDSLEIHQSGSGSFPRPVLTPRSAEKAPAPSDPFKRFPCRRFLTSKQLRAFPRALYCARGLVHILQYSTNLHRKKAPHRRTGARAALRQKRCLTASVVSQ